MIYYLLNHNKKTFIFLCRESRETPVAPHPIPLDLVRVLVRVLVRLFYLFLEK